MEIFADNRRREEAIEKWMLTIVADDVDFQTRGEFEERLNWSPPSLYLFHRGEGPRNKKAQGDSALDLDPSIFTIREAGVICYYLEFLQQNAEDYCRSVFIEG